MPSSSWAHPKGYPHADADDSMSPSRIAFLLFLNDAAVFATVLKNR